MTLPPPLLVLCFAIALIHAAPAHAQHAGHDQHPAPPVSAGCTAEHAAMGHCKVPVQVHDACTPEHAAMGHCIRTSAQPQAHDACTPEHAAMGHCMPAAGPEDTPREPIPPLTDADRAAAFPPMARQMEHGAGAHWRVLLNRFEARDADHGSSQAWEGVAWIGGDTRRLWLRSEGEREAGRTRSATLEVLYGHAISPWWDVVTGIRHDFAPRDGRTWAAIGLQGMAPHRLEISATGYIGESGQSAATVEVEHDLLLTNRLVLQPVIEARLYGRSDATRGIGAGLSTIDAGLRLRYEATRRFAPYAGYTWSRAFGRTADLRETAGEPATSHGWAAGVRVWF